MSALSYAINNHYHAGDESDSDLTPEFKKVGFNNIPAQHPVALFSARYESFVEGLLIPNEEELFADPMVSHIAPWLQHVEPVQRGVYVDFRVTSGDQPFNSQNTAENGKWMDEVFSGAFLTPRYHEAVAASTLRVPMFSRGTVPSTERAFIMQYRGVFPMFADTRARHRLAIIAAETYITISAQET